VSARGERLKLPGLFHRSELVEVIEVDGEHEFVFEHAGHDRAGRELIAIYCRVRRRAGGGEVT
jgi:hypothetical protein